MDLQEFKNYNIRQKTGIREEKFGKIFVFIDFANVDKWFADDIRDWDDNILENSKKLSIDLEKLSAFTKCFSDLIIIITFLVLISILQLSIFNAVSC